MKLSTVNRPAAKEVKMFSRNMSFMSGFYVWHNACPSLFAIFPSYSLKKTFCFLTANPISRVVDYVMQNTLSSYLERIYLLN
jgi:hypothetical protein